MGLALRTRCLPSEWEREDPIAIRTALELLAEQDARERAELDKTRE